MSCTFTFLATICSRTFQAGEVVHAKILEEPR